MDVDQIVELLPKSTNKTTRELVKQSLLDCCTACNTKDFAIVFQDVYACARNLSQTKSEEELSTIFKHLKMVCHRIPRDILPLNSCNTIKNYEKAVIARLFPDIDEADDEVDDENLSQTTAEAPKNPPVAVVQTPSKPSQHPDLQYGHLLDAFAKLQTSVASANDMQQARIKELTQQHALETQALRQEIECLKQKQQQLADLVHIIAVNSPAPCSSAIIDYLMTR